MAEKLWFPKLLYTPKSEVPEARVKMDEKGIPDTFLYTPKSGVLEPF